MDKNHSVSEPMEPTDKVQEALSDLMDAFMERYAPASSWEQADEHFSSAEVAGMFNSVYPIPLDKIYEALIENGFKCVPSSGQASFVWLLTLKKK